MTETADRLAAAEQARDAKARWIDPVLIDLKAQYAKMIIEIAGQPTRKRDPERIERLSMGVKVIDHIQAEIEMVIADGAVARHDQQRANRLAEMTDEQRKWFSW